MQSFNNNQQEIPIAPGGTPAVTEWGLLGRILKTATLAEMEAGGWDVSESLEEGYSPDTVLYWFEAQNGTDNYIWRENLYPVPIAECDRDEDKALALNILEDDYVLDDIARYYEGDWAVTKIVRDGDEIIICTQGENPTQMQRPENWTDEQWEGWEQPKTSLFGFQDFDEAVVHYGWHEEEELSSHVVVLWKGYLEYSYNEPESAEDPNTISVAEAAEQLETNVIVIQSWISRGRIHATGQGLTARIDKAQFDRLVQDIRNWLKSYADSDETGFTRASVEEMEQLFWKERDRRNQGAV